MVEHVEQRCRQRQRRGEDHAVGAEGEREAQADIDDADVLDRVVGEEAFEVVLHQRVEDAHHRGDAAEDKHDRRPPPLDRSEQIEDDADERVDRYLGHHSAHQGRDMARRCRVGEWQPHVQWHDAGLRPGTE